MKEELFQTVKKLIDTIDVYNLLAEGAPKDEFDAESAMIARRLKKGMTAYSIADVIAQVMNERFYENFSADDFIFYVTQIEKFLNST